VFHTKAFERRDDVLLFHFDCAGDHTRGLFEAEASVAVSTTHAFQNIEIFLFASHDCIRSFNSFLSSHAVLAENPTFCVVIDSIAASGANCASTSTRTRTKIRHDAFNQLT